MANGNGHTAVERVLSIIESRGIPLLITAALFVGAVLYVPPIVRSHLDALESQQKTLESMDTSLSEISEADYPRPDFREQVTEEHREQDEAHQRQAACQEKQTEILERIADTLEKPR